MMWGNEGFKIKAEKDEITELIKKKIFYLICQNSS